MKLFTIITSCLLLVVFFPSTTTAKDGAFNITHVLSKLDGYNTFNNLLSETKLAEIINSRQTITVLAVKDGSASSLSSKPHEVAKRILSTHIVLDFYDMKKLKNLKNGTTTLTTLFQSFGVASGQQGFLNVTDMGHGELKLGSAANKDGNLDVSINKLVTSQGYDLSVLDVSGVINVPGIENIHVAPAHSPRKMLAPPPADGPASAPGPDKEKSSSPSAETPKATEGPASAEDSEDSDGSDAPAPGKSGAVSSRLDINYLAGLTVFLVVSFFMAS